MKSHGFRDTGRFTTRPASKGAFAPNNPGELTRCFAPGPGVTNPLRPMGSGTSLTDCNTANTGSSIDTTRLDRILNIDRRKQTVTAEAGVRIGALVAALASENLELIGSFDQTERTLGGAICSPCMGPGIGGQASLLSSQVLALKAVLPDGKSMSIGVRQQQLMSAFRLSYGMLGVVYQVTLRVRPVKGFSASHRCTDIETFSKVTDRLANGDIGLKFYLLPYMNQVYLDLRHHAAARGDASSSAWKIKNWSENTVLPGLVKSLQRLLPFAGMRYQLIDRISATTHGLVNTRHVKNGNNGAASGRYKRTKPRKILFSTWCFPAADFSIVVKAYARFCRETFARTAYRCDLPAVGFRVCQDNSALLSPSFDEPLIALQTLSTEHRGWENFTLELAEFAETWGGTPIFNQTLATRSEYVSHMYNHRIAFFQKIRRQLDPHNRLLNPYLARYFT